MTIMGPKMVQHPAGQIMPPMDPERFKHFCSDIRAHGLREPIVIHEDGRILEGWHRYRACCEMDVMPSFRTWHGRPGTEVDFVLSMNLHRRHLNESQRAMVGAKIKEYEMTHSPAAKKDKKGPAVPTASANLRSEPTAPEGKASERAAEQLNVSARSVETAAKVLREGAPELVAAVERGEVSVHAAEAVATELPKAEQAEIVARGEEEILRVAKEIRERRKQSSTDAYTGSSEEAEERYTPKTIVERARAVMGSIHLDPASCADANRIVQAVRYYTKDQDGLKQPLVQTESVFCNPPYGWSSSRESLSEIWVQHLLGAFARGIFAHLTLVVFAALGEKWFAPLWDHAICFPSDRVKFWTVDRGEDVVLKQPMKASAVIYCGPNVEAFAREFVSLGRVVIPARLMTPAIAAIDGVSATIGRAA